MLLSARGAVLLECVGRCVACCALRGFWCKAQNIEFYQVMMRGDLKISSRGTYAQM